MVRAKVRGKAACEGNVPSAHTPLAHHWSKAEHPLLALHHLQPKNQHMQHPIPTQHPTPTEDQQPHSPPQYTQHPTSLQQCQPHSPTQRPIHKEVHQPQVPPGPTCTTTHPGEDRGTPTQGTTWPHVYRHKNTNNDHGGPH